MWRRKVWAALWVIGPMLLYPAVGWCPDAFDPDPPWWAILAVCVWTLLGFVLLFRVVAIGIEPEEKKDYTEF